MRLTEKENKPLPHCATKNIQFDLPKIIDKLGQLEDILEEYDMDNLVKLRFHLDLLRELTELKNELGIDLITLFRAFSCIWYKKGNELKMSCHIALIDWTIYVLEESMTIGEGVSLQLKDYGKTWALTKEELL